MRSDPNFWGPCLNFWRSNPKLLRNNPYCWDIVSMKPSEPWHMTFVDSLYPLIFFAATRPFSFWNIKIPIFRKLPQFGGTGPIFGWKNWKSRKRIYNVSGRHRNFATCSLKLNCSCRPITIYVFTFVRQH